MKILITGIGGFAASHLVKILLKHKAGYDNTVEIHGTKRVRSDMYRLEKLGIADKITYHLIELTDPISVYNVIKEVMPDQIYHLAAQDYVWSSWNSPHETFDTNVGGTINLFQAIRQCYPRIGQEYQIGDGVKYPLAKAKDVLVYPKVLVTSTSETYGYHNEKINESTEQKPTNPYGISKLTQDQLARLYSKAYNIPVVITRAFNITGWGRNDPFVDSNFAKQIAEIEKGVRQRVQHGNLESRRSFFDVKDAVRGYYLAMQSEHKNGDVFCFGPKKSTSIAELLDILVKLSSMNIKLEKDQSRSRPIDTPDMLCDAYKAEMILGWKPEIPLEQSLKDLLYYWRDRI